MSYTILSVASGKKSTILRESDEVGSVERLATGYMVTLYDPPLKVKRYRMIDALREALGEEAEIHILG